MYTTTPLYCTSTLYTFRYKVSTNQSSQLLRALISRYDVNGTLEKKYAFLDSRRFAALVAQKVWGWVAQPALAVIGPDTVYN